MKIISSYNDYYDCLAYVHGVDSRLELIRPSVITDKKETDWIGNKNAKIEMVALNLPRFNFNYPSVHNARINEIDYIYKEFSVRVFCFFGIFCVKYTAKDNVEFKIYKEDETVNAAHELLGTPIFEIESLNSRWKSHLKNQIGEYKKDSVVLTVLNNVPTLKSIGIEKVISAEQMYSIAEQWIRNRKSNENLVVLNNKEKIVKAGFDLKKSFRGKKNNGNSKNMQNMQA